MPAASTLSDLVEILPGLADPAIQLARESRLLGEAAQAGDFAPRAFIWRGRQSLIAAPTDQHLPSFDAAAGILRSRGWPVVVRQTGGTAVPLTPGIVNLSLLLPWQGPPPGLAPGYAALCAPLLAALAALGVPADTGAVPHAICDGAANIRIGARKLVGTSQRQSPRGSHGAVLLHAGVLVDVDVQMATRIVSEFYALAGERRDYAAGALVSLAECLGERATATVVEDFIVALQAALARNPPSL